MELWLESTGLLYHEIISKTVKRSGAIIPDMNGLRLKGGFWRIWQVSVGPGLSVAITDNFRVHMTIYKHCRICGVTFSDGVIDQSHHGH